MRDVQPRDLEQYDFVHDNLFVAFYPCDHTNDTAVIRRRR
jgi:hypothetical protein